MDERPPEHEVLRGVAAERALRERDDVRPALPGVLRPAQDEVSVACEVADGDVDLREGYPKLGHAPSLRSDGPGTGGIGEADHQGRSRAEDHRHRNSLEGAQMANPREVLFQ